jgi:Fe-S cluster assembly protein SufD
VQHASPNENHQDYKEYSLINRRFQRKNFRRKEPLKKQMRFKSNNILLSDKATINAKPQLEILLMM